MIKTNLKEFIGELPEEVRVRRVLGMLATILNSNDFKQAVISKKSSYTKCTGFWKWKKCYISTEDGFSATNLTNLEVYNKIVSGSTKDDPSQDSIIDISVEVLEGSGKNKNVIGYTYPNSSKTFTYRDHFSKMTDVQLIGHIFHEYLHRVGFTHSSAKDYNSVPYSLGYAVSSIANRLF